MMIDMGYFDGQRAAINNQERSPESDDNYPDDGTLEEKRRYEANWIAGFDEWQRQNDEETSNG